MFLRPDRKKKLKTYNYVVNSIYLLLCFKYSETEKQSSRWEKRISVYFASTFYIWLNFERKKKIPYDYQGKFNFNSY